MRYRITEHDSEVEIHVGPLGERAPELLASLLDCQHGRCGCPTDQFDRLEDMTVRADAEELTITLKPRVGQRLDTEQLRACLDYTLEHSPEARP